MDFFQGVVVEYLRARRSYFVNTEYYIQLDHGKLNVKDRHWYCDAVVVSPKERCAFLCEISYAQTLHTLCKRLHAWAEHWPEIQSALERDSGVPLEWDLRPWVFIPKEMRAQFESGKPPSTPTGMPDARITYLESCLPWVYKNTWDRGEDDLAEDHQRQEAPA